MPERILDRAPASAGNLDSMRIGTSGVLAARNLQRDTATLRVAPKAPTVSVVIPALNEAKNLPYILPLIPTSIYEVILVDGGSTDGTAAVAQALLPSITIVQQNGRGKGNALRCGFEAATGDIVVMMDADVSMNPGEIPLYTGALLAGADLAKGSRFLQGGGTADMPLYRQVGNKCLTWLVRLLFGGSYSDLCYGYAAFWRDTLPRLNLDSNGFEIETLINVRALKAGMHIVEVPSFEYSRLYGEGRLRAFRDGVRVLKTILRESVVGASRRRSGGPKNATGPGAPMLLSQLASRPEAELTPFIGDVAG